MWLAVLVPAIVFHHVCQLNDKLPLLVLLTGFKCMFLEEGREEDHLMALLKCIYYIQEAFGGGMIVLQ